MPSRTSGHNGRIMGLSVHNPIGLAAGIDRTGYLLTGAAKAGFGFTEVGSVTPQTLESTLRNLRRNRSGGLDMTVGVNIRSTPGETGWQAISSYLLCLRSLLPVSDYVVLNLAAPRSAKGMACNLDWLEQLLSAAIVERELFRMKSNIRVPLAIKVPISPGLSVHQEDILKLCRQLALEGVLVVSPADQDAGSTCKLLRSVKAIVKDTDVISIGGVASADHVVARLDAGAAAVQVFSSVLDQGVLLPKHLLMNLPLSANSGIAL
jgi:dihydroorotate dehydrogenase